MQTETEPLTRIITLTPGFECEYEVHELQTFQSDGHFVSGLKDDNGFRRQWETDEVHVLTLRHKGEQVLRMMADTLEEVSRLMSSEIQSTFLGLWTAAFVRGFNYEQFRRQNDRVNELQTFIDERYKAEIASGKHGAFQDVFATVMYYLGMERELKAGEVTLARIGNRTVSVPQRKTERPTRKGVKQGWRKRS